MQTSSFDLFTVEGEALAARLIGLICTDVEADRLTRKQALDKAADALERISEVDAGLAQPEPLSAIARRLSAAFARVGYVPVAGDDLRIHYEQWQRTGAPVSVTAVPADVAAAAAAARAVSVAYAEIASDGGLACAVARALPWSEAFAADPAAHAEVALFTYDGEYTDNPQVSCLLMGPDNSAYVEQIATHLDPAGVLREHVFKRPEIDYPALASRLIRLTLALDDLNVAINKINEPERLALRLTGAEATVLWDGAAVSPPAAPPAPVAEAALEAALEAVEAAPEPEATPALPPSPTLMPVAPPSPARPRAARARAVAPGGLSFGDPAAPPAEPDSGACIPGVQF